MHFTAKRLIFLSFILAYSFTLRAQDKPSFKLFFEKVYLHTDRNLYAQGDTLWFKAYLVNAQNNQPIGTSGNLYVDLIEQDSAKIINSEIIRMDFGTGNGDISLSDSIPSGKYTLRAYTNWMRNFGDNFVFEKEITILNTTTKKADTVAASNKSANKATKTSAAKVPAIVHIPVARFYPESGSLITGVSSIVAVKTEDRFGKGIPAKGAVLSSAGDTVAHFSCDTLGMGLFVLLPMQGQNYHAIINTKNQQGLNADLPQPLTKGFSIRVSHSDSLTNVIISCNDAEFAEVKGHSFALSGKHGGKTYFNKNIQINDSQSLIRIDNNLLPDGITAITLTDDQNKPHCERLVYINHKSVPLTIITDKTEYQSKEKVTVDIKTNGGKANISMVVVDAGIVPVQPENIQSYLMLQSELKGEIEQPNRYFDTTNVNRHKQLDMLLLTQGWRDFIWRRLADTAIRISYKAEDGFDIVGKVRQKLADKAMPDLNITLNAFKARGTKIFTNKTDSIGHFSINNVLLYGPQVIKLTTSNNVGKRVGWITIDSLFKPLSGIVPHSNNVLDSGYSSNEVFYKRLADIKNGKIKGSRVLKEVTIKADKRVMIGDIIGVHFGYPDEFFNIEKKDYYFETLDNWLAHNLKNAIVMDTPGVVFYGVEHHHVRNTYIESPGYHKVYPHFVINGQEVYTLSRPVITDVVTDYEFDHMIDDMYMPYFTLPMDKVKQVVYKHLMGPGGEDFYMIYLTITDDAFEKQDFGLVTTQVKGYYQSRIFYKPLYDSPKDQSKTDLRTTIHWEPNIITDANGHATVNFYNADPKTKVRIIVEGIKATGGPITGTSVYTVK
ncbi:hypothetical protein [uncultured Mucilaginibacter sp.]|uniref:hypothetical protein n=1 Tax=uncultured Mucilaginibacter sp. TaxID=797541 RepID=UPI0025F082CA|nr:hypothetical protein [uncultured Mucilaginibacter sp.]